MATQARWMELFREIIGRDPEPEEFFAGKASGFDLKQIKPIAGVDFEQAAPATDEAAPEQSAVLEEAADVSEQPTESPLAETDAATPAAEPATADAETVWVDKFMALMGRFPTEAEMAQGAQTGYSLASLAPFLQESQPENESCLPHLSLSW